MTFWFTHREAQRNSVQEGRIGEHTSATGKILADIKVQLIAADWHRAPPDQWLISTAIGIGDRASDQAAPAEFGKFDQLDCDSWRRPPTMGMEHRGRQAPLDLESIVRDDELIDPKCRNPADLLNRSIHFGRD